MFGLNNEIEMKSKLSVSIHIVELDILEADFLTSKDIIFFLTF
jgi:hypothetical protein